MFVLASGMVVNRMLASNAVLCATVTAAVCTGVGHVFIRRGRIAFAAQNLKVILYKTIYLVHAGSEVEGRGWCITMYTL